MKLLKIVAHKWNNTENRDKRELSVCRELGMEIVVLSKNEQEKKAVNKEIDGFNVWEYPTKPFPDNKFFKPLNKFCSLITWTKIARKFQADIISGHDWIALGIGYLSNLGKRKKKKAKLVYDSHEFELGRNTTKKRGKIKLFFIAKIEKFLMKRCAFSIMVNDSIADAIQKQYKLKNRPIVVRNIPPCWDLDVRSIAETRNFIQKKFDKERENFLIMYHGGVMRGRGIENIIKALTFTKDVCLVILGNGEVDYKNSLCELCVCENVEKRVLFMDAVKIQELYKYVGAVDVGMIIIENSCKSYYLCLPNKFFENIQSLTPVITSNFPELQKLTEQYQIGLCIDPADIHGIAAAIEEMRDNKEFYNRCKENLKVAKRELCWENEKEKLKNAYADLMKNASFN